jgi:glutaredoxin-like YruB-family protein
MNVTVYSSPTCGYCHQVKQYLTQRGVQFTEHDLSVDRAAAEEMTRKTGQMGVPVIVIDDQVVVGFDRPRLDQLLSKQEDRQRVSLGIKAADASKFAQKHGAIPVFGALVGGVRQGSPGQTAGLQEGDIITEINLRPVHSVNDLESALGSLSQGSMVSIVYQRGQNEHRSEIVL